MKLHTSGEDYLEAISFYRKKQERRVRSTLPDIWVFQKQASAAL